MSLDVVIITEAPGQRVHGYDCDCCRDESGRPRKDTLIEVMQAVSDALDKIPEVAHEHCMDGAALFKLQEELADQRPETPERFYLRRLVELLGHTHGLRSTSRAYRRLKGERIRETLEGARKLLRVEDS